jgi:pimeloyl-ACP methyl ester carboxylesterase
MMQFDSPHHVSPTVDESRAGVLVAIHTRREAMAIIFDGRSGTPLVADIEGRWHGAPVVLLHSQNETRRVWQPTMMQLGEHGFLVIAYDARGCGDSGRVDDGDLSVTAQMSDLRHVIDQLGGQAFVVARGMSTMVAQYGAAGSRATSTSALVLIDPTPPSPVMFRSGLSREEIERAVASVSAPTLVLVTADPSIGDRDAQAGTSGLGESDTDALLDFLCAHTQTMAAV